MYRGENASDEPDRERDLFVALLAGRFDVARGFLRGSRGEVSPYRSVAERVSLGAAAERAIDLLEADDPIGAYFCLVDADQEPHPLEPAIFSALGAILERRGEPVMARAAYREGITPDDAMRLDATIPMTEMAMDDAVQARGVEHYRARLEEAPGDVAAEEGLVLRLARVGAPSEVEPAARALIARAPTRVAAHLVLVEALAQDEREADALAASEAACDACGGVAEVWIARGEILERAARPDEARSAFERAMELDPASWPALLGVERILAEQGDEAELVEHYRRMHPHAETGGEADRIADAIDRLEGALRGGEAALEAQRKIAQRRQERAAEIDALLEVRPVAGLRHRGPEVAVAAVFFSALVIGLAIYAATSLPR